MLLEGSWMPPIRFRIRTIMIATVIVAVIMAVLIAVMRVFPPWTHPFRDAFSVFYSIVIYMISHPIIAFLLAIVLFGSVVQFVVFWDRFRSLRRRPGHVARKAYGPNARPDPNRSRAPR
jgi:hypothetical protein